MRRLRDAMHTGPALTINLSALKQNYHLLQKKAAHQNAAAVVKANAYGLGVDAVSRALLEAGCNTFFVATLDEGIELRRILPTQPIYIFHGPYFGEEKDYLAHTLSPVLNSVEQITRWLPHAATQHFAVHIDTGMTRLGISLAEAEQAAPQLAPHAPLLMTHLACADVPAHPLNQQQLAQFRTAKKYFPQSQTSIANSSGIFLSEEYHGDLLRPGCAIYGITPTPYTTNPMQHVATLSAPILQIHEAQTQVSVGYGADYTAPKGAQLATIQLGYADGFFRNLGNLGECVIAGTRTRIVGRVSMDMLIADVSHLPAAKLTPTARAEFINETLPVDHLAKQAGTIGYEIFTRLGARIKRVYI